DGEQDRLEVQCQHDAANHPKQRADRADQAACTINTCITPRGVRPRVRRIAMSACLSVTSITCEDTRLNAPMAMISDSRIASSVFSMASARNMLAFSVVQSLTL